jgi:hypothetical protein
MWEKLFTSWQKGSRKRRARTRYNPEEHNLLPLARPHFMKFLEHSSQNAHSHKLRTKLSIYKPFV